MSLPNKRKYIIDLKEAESAPVGMKAQRLAKLMSQEPFLFTVPPGLVVLPGFDIRQHADELSSAIESFGKGPFAVRSCGLGEDAVNESMAGRYHTELFVSSKAIMDAIASVRASYGLDADSNAVIIQQMINPDYAGVLFTQSPENDGLSSCEYGPGTAEAVVSGKVEPIHVDYGRWTGNLYPARKENNDMLSSVFLVGLIIETMIGKPQDIEWAYDKKKGILYILQSRDITSQIYDPSIANEQINAANIALGIKGSKKGTPVFQNTAVREVVSNPTRLTRSYIERIYSLSGSLGKALDLIGLPYPAISTPYVISIFGQLYENNWVKQKIFGLRPRLLWANRRLKKKLIKAPDHYLAWLEKSIADFPSYPASGHQSDLSPINCAQRVIMAFNTFFENVYPTAYAAKFLAQLSGEITTQASVTSQMLCDLSKLYHTGDIQMFLKTWGLRSANDYELSEPRFCEAPDAAMDYAKNFSDFPWHKTEDGHGFTHLSEIAKDRAVQWLYPLRCDILELEERLHLESGMIFSLDLSTIEALASGQLEPDVIYGVCETNLNAEVQWTTLDLGDSISLENIECLRKSFKREKGLRGKMVSSRTPFKGKALHLEKLTDHQPIESNTILIAKYLEPEIVGLFPKTSGCIVDMGGTLSHAAIVARELGYPVLVLAGCNSTILDNDFIEVTADGTITIRRDFQNDPSGKGKKNTGQPLVEASSSGAPPFLPKDTAAATERQGLGKNP